MEVRVTTLVPSVLLILGQGKVVHSIYVNHFDIEANRKPPFIRRRPNFTLDEMVFIKQKVNIV